MAFEPEMAGLPLQASSVVRVATVCACGRAGWLGYGYGWVQKSLGLSKVHEEGLERYLPFEVAGVPKGTTSETTTERKNGTWSA